MLRERQTVYAVLSVTVSVDGARVGTPRNGTYMATGLRRAAIALAWRHG